MLSIKYYNNTAIIKSPGLSEKDIIDLPYKGLVIMKKPEN